MFVVYGYAIYRLFWYIPSWLTYLPVGDILIIVAYMATMALFESLVFLVLIILAAFLFPERYFKNRFVVQGSVVVWIMTIWALVVHEDLNRYISELNYQEFAVSVLTSLILILISIALVSQMFVFRLRWLEKIIGIVAERMTIFLYVYLPLSLVGLVTILIQNIF
jgi:hypothetical protein